MLSSATSIAATAAIGDQFELLADVAATAAIGAGDAGAARDRRPASPPPPRSATRTAAVMPARSPPPGAELVTPVQFELYSRCHRP